MVAVKCKGNHPEWVKSIKELCPMNNDQQSPQNQVGHISITGQVSGENVAIGHGSHIQVTRTLINNGQPAIDLETLKKSLVELYGHLQAAGLPAETQMEAQAAA